VHFWAVHGGLSEHAPAYAFTQPAFTTSLLISLASVLYMFAFFGVAFVGADVSDLMSADEAASAAAAAVAAHRWDRADADVVIVGLGLAGSSLATVLGRQGKRVLVIERSPDLYESIKGELLQPGGVRALERMGLAQCAKTREVDPVRVDGYVCIRAVGPDAAACSADAAHTVLMNYPQADPASWMEYLGWPGQGGASSGRVLGSGTGETEVDPTTNADVHPRGRSFHNVRFVAQLRAAAQQEPNVRIEWGSARRPVTAKDVQSVGWTSDPDRIVGVAWVPNGGGPERTSLAPLTVVADGMYSALRPSMHTNAPRTVSHFCGLLLKHGPGQTPLPYPNRGHVIMCTPNPVLFYQISSTETRVLVDVPADSFSDDADKLRAYFTDTIAPQLPPVLQGPFKAAAAEQEAICMPNRALTAASPTKTGVVMVGDTLNMRHPLTGGGMTVALKDVELLSSCLSRVSLAEPAFSEKSVEQAIARFSSKRNAHAATINILANALHRVFTTPAHDDGRRLRLKDACVDYLGMGGMHSAGPIGLLSGLTPKPDVLVAHFFAVALHAIRRALLPFPTPLRLREGYDLLHVACIIIMPLLAGEGVTVMANGGVGTVVNALFPWRNVDPATFC
jgi:squalene monooxygenase